MEGNSKLLRKRDVKQLNDQLKKDESIPSLPILPPPGFPYVVRPVSMQPPFIPPDVPALPILPPPGFPYEVRPVSMQPPFIPPDVPALPILPPPGFPYEVRPVSMQPPFIPPDVPPVPIQPGIPPFEYLEYQKRKFLDALGDLFLAFQNANPLWYNVFDQKFETLEQTVQQLILTVEGLTAKQQLGLKPWYQLYNEESIDHFYTINPGYKKQVLRQYPFVEQGILVYMMDESSTCPHKVEVKGYFDEIGLNNFYTTNEDETGPMPLDTSYNWRTYCVREKDQCSATVPIQRYQLINGGTKTDDYYDVGDVREIEGYRFKETMCYGWPKPEGETTAKPKMKSATINTDNLVYKVNAKTSNITDEAENTRTEIFIQLYGTEGETLPISLETVVFDDGKEYIEHFKKGAVASFSIAERDVGKIVVLRLFANGTNGWFCEGVTIDVPEKDESYYFIVNRKIDKEGLDVSGLMM